MKKRRMVVLGFLLGTVIGSLSAQEVQRHSAEAEQLLQCLRAIEGQKTISGTMACVNWNLNEARWVHQHTSKWPALNGFVLTRDDMKALRQQTAGISPVPERRHAGDVTAGAAYDLSGIHLKKQSRGLHIVNGKKHISR